MRKTIVVLTLVVLASVGYLGWPIYTLGTLARAVEAKDVATVMSHVDISAVRKSLIEQVLDAYLKLTGKTASPLLRGVVVAAAEPIVDPIIARMIAPEALTDLLHSGWPGGVLPDRPAGIGGLTSANLGSVWQIYSSAQYGLRRFEISVPPSLPRARQFELEFRLIAWRWRLAGVRLPEDVRVKLAETLVKSQAKR